MSKKARRGRFESLGSAAQRVLDKRLKKQLAEYQAVEAWPDAAGQDISKRCIAMGIKSGILYVSVPTSVWSTELNALKRKLIAKLNDRLGQEVVKDIRFKVGAMRGKDG